MITIDECEIIKSKQEVPEALELIEKARELLSRGDKKKAVAEYKKAIKLGSVYAPNLLGELYFNENTKPNKKKILELMLMGAKRGDIVAQKNVGIRLQDVEYVKKVDYTEAFKYLYSSASQGNSEACIALAYLYVSFKIEKDEYEAAIWADHALDDIHDEAFNLINHLTISTEEIIDKADEYFYGTPNTKVNYEKAAILFHVSTIMVHPSIYGNAMLGYCYMFGKGVKTDLIKAKTYFNIALDAGNTSVKKYLDKLEDALRPYKWDDNINVKFDEANTEEQQKLLNIGANHFKSKKYSDALDYYLRAAKLGCNDGYTKMGYMFMNGQGTKPSPQKAFKMFKEAADMGDAIAQYEVARLYLSGTGCDKSEKQAFYYMYQASVQGNPLATRETCKYYRDGIGCEVDHIEAFYWLSKTFNAKDKESIELFDSLNNVDGKEAAVRGNLYYTGKKVIQDFSRAFAYYYAGAESSVNPSASCMYNCGLCYFYGRGTDRDFKAAIDYATAAKNHGYKNADSLITKARIEYERSQTL